jgi:hypothetical protein
MLQQTPHATPRGARCGQIALILALLLCCVEPALANKFETIGGGFGGSSSYKREWLQHFFLATGGVTLTASLLALTFPHGNPLLLNFSNWKASSAVLGALATACFAAAALI